MARSSFSAAIKLQSDICKTLHDYTLPGTSPIHTSVDDLDLISKPVTMTMRLGKVNMKVIYFSRDVLHTILDFIAHFRVKSYLFAAS